MYISNHHNAKYKAAIHTHCHTGEHRLFYEKIINGERKVVKVTGANYKTFEVTGYGSVSEIVCLLKNATPVYLDEQILLNGEPIEHKLKGVSSEEFRPKYTVQAVREVVAKKVGIPWNELEVILREAA